MLSLISTLRDQQQRLREVVAERFAIAHTEFSDALFFRTGSHSISLGRASELPIESMLDNALKGPWCQNATALRHLTKPAVHLLRQRAKANILNLNSQQIESFLGHVPITVEVPKATITPGCVIVEHRSTVLGIGWLDLLGQIKWYTSDSGAYCFREEHGRDHSILFH